MLRSGIPGITDKGVEFIQKALLPGLTDTQATAIFTKLVFGFKCSMVQSVLLKVVYFTLIVIPVYTTCFHPIQ